MSACGAVDKSHAIEFKALEDSLDMMSKGIFGIVPSPHSTDSVYFPCSSQRRTRLVSPFVNTPREIINFRQQPHG